MIRFPRREVKTKNLGGNGGMLIDTDICQPSVLENVETCRRRRCKVTHYIKTAQFKGRALRYFILCGKRNTKPFDVICAIVVAYIGRTECRLLSFKPLFSFTIFKCLWGHSHHCQAPKKQRRKKRRTSRSLRPNVKSG